MQITNPGGYKCRLPEEEKELIRYAVSEVGTADGAAAALDALMVPGIIERESFRIDAFTSEEEWLGFIKWFADYLPALKALSDYDFLNDETVETLSDIVFVAAKTYEYERSRRVQTIDKPYLYGMVSMVRGLLSFTREKLTDYASFRISETMGVIYANPNIPTLGEFVSGWNSTGGNPYAEEIFNLWFRNLSVRPQDMVNVLDRITGSMYRQLTPWILEPLSSASYKRTDVLKLLAEAESPELGLIALRNPWLPAELEEYVVTRPDALTETIIVGMGDDMRTPANKLEYFLHDDRVVVRFAAMVRLAPTLTDEYIYDILTVERLEWYQSLSGSVSRYWFADPKPSAYFGTDEEWWDIAIITCALSLVDQRMLDAWAVFDPEKVSRIMLVKVLN